MLSILLLLLGTLLNYISQAVRWQRRYDYRRAKRNGTGVLSKTFGKGRPIRQADLMRRV